MVRQHFLSFCRLSFHFVVSFAVHSSILKVCQVFALDIPTRKLQNQCFKIVKLMLWGFVSGPVFGWDLGKLCVSVFPFVRAQILYEGSNIIY